MSLHCLFNYGGEKAGNYACQSKDRKGEYINMKDKILVINPGSTSTKIAVFKNHSKIVEESVQHSKKQLSRFRKISDQYEFRTKAVEELLKVQGVLMNELICISARGGLLRPLPKGGTYFVNEQMCEELVNAKHEHACNLGALIAFQIGNRLGIPAFIVDPVIVDEMSDLAKLSGYEGVRRKAMWHPLNQKAIARQVAGLFGKTYQEINCIVAHLGGGITVGAHFKGRTIDVNNGLDGDGPYSPERTGGLPNEALLGMVYDEGLSQDEIMKRLVGEGGCVSYLHTNDARDIEQMIVSGNKRAELIFEGMAYQISKEIGAMSTVLSGEVDAIALTGGLAYSSRLTAWIRERVSFIAPVFLFPGEGEMEALNEGARRVMDGLEEAILWEEN